jgi:hypothetical protein
MKMHFNNGTQIEIELVQGDVATDLTKIYKHLQHVPLNFKKWDNPFYLDHVTLDELINNLKILGTQVAVDVDTDKCFASQQSYYNQLHKIYEIGYNGNPEWLDFHEHIHLCEQYYRNLNPRSISIDYRERAGPLTKIFNNAYLSNMITEIVPGTVYVEWAELGKPPYYYWLDKEPDDLDRLCQLAKPWLTFKPRLRVATQHINLLEHVDLNFHNWWEQYESNWCKHWHIAKWPIEFMKGVIQVGKINDEHLNVMIDLFRQQMPVERITLR